MFKGPEALDERHIWWVAAAFGVLITAGIVLLFRPPVVPPMRALAEPQLVALLASTGGKHDLLAAETEEFSDPTPLFMPTRWNSSVKQLPRPEYAGSFPGFAPRFEFDAERLDLAVAPTVAVPASPAAALEMDPPGNPSLGFGRTDSPPPTAPARQARVQVYAEGSGQEVGSFDLPPGAVPELAGGGWHYLDFAGAVDAAGLVGPLVPAPGLSDRTGNYFPPLSGTALTSLETYLTHRLLLGAHLTPGFYRISVGP